MGKATVGRLEECLADPTIWNCDAERVPNLFKWWSLSFFYSQRHIVISRLMKVSICAMNLV